MANFWGDAWEGLKDVVDPFDVTGQEAAEQASQDNAANLETQKKLAQDAQDFFKSQSDLGIAGIQDASVVAQGALNNYLDGASGKLDTGMARATRAIDQGRSDTLGELAQGYQQGRGDVSGGYTQGRGDLAAGYGQARGDLGRVQDLQRYGAGATQAIGAYDVAGQQPGSLASVAAQQQAQGFGGFEQDPGYRFRQQQGEEAISRQAAAQGGRGGGATMKALADYNQGLASQEFGNYANRQMAVNQQQLGAAGQSDQMRLAALTNQAGRADQAALAAQGNQMGLAGMGYGAQGQLAGMAQQYGAGQAGMSVRGGQALGDMANQYGLTRAGVSTQHAGDVAGLIQRTAGTQAGMTYGTGGALADLIYGTGTDVANIGIGVGAQGVDSSKSLMGAYNDALNNQQAIDQNKREDNKETAGMIAGFFSDSRLKVDIETVPGSRFERIGLRGVSWRWNGDAKCLGLEGHASGVIAQEVREKYPQAVVERDGFLAVNYVELDRLVGEAP